MIPRIPAVESFVKQALRFPGTCNTAIKIENYLKIEILPSSRRSKHLEFIITF